MQITPQMLLKAYSIGVFPMSESALENKPVSWFKPKERGVLPLDERFHLSRSLKKHLKRQNYRVVFNRNFDAVLHACAGRCALVQPREDTWINADIFSLYHNLHHLGHAHSVEVYCPENTLIGGLYGVSLGAAFFGESMFSRQTNASKIALVALVSHLRKRHFSLLDCQFMTDHLEQFGGYTITAEEYERWLEHAIGMSADFL